MKRTFGLLVALSFLSPVLPAQEVLPLEKAVALAREKSPDIHSLQTQAESAEAKVAQALAPYEPVFTYSMADMETPFRFGSQASTVYQLQEQVGFPGRAFVNRSALDNQAHAVRAQVRTMELQVASQVKNAYYQLTIAQANLNLNRDQRESFARIAGIAKRRYESGAIPQVDLINAQVALYANDNDLSDLIATEKSARAQLNIYLGKALDSELQVEPFKSKKLPIPEMTDAEGKMVSNRNELRAARYQLKAAEDTYRLAQMSVLPDFQFTAGSTFYNRPEASPIASSNPGAQQTYMFGVQLTIPIFFLFNERQAMRSASFDRATADANLQILLNQSRANLKSTIETLKALDQRISNSEKHLLPLSEQALSLALISYSAGKIDFQTLVDTATARRNARRDYYTAVVNYISNYATLGQLMGEEL
jgi:outer membrane protein TolC